MGVWIVLGLLACASVFSPALCSKGTDELARGFWIADDKFWKDGQPFQIMGGDIHYFRVHPQYWEDRLLRAKALGLNAIQTYVAWNVHQPRQMEIHFDGFADLEAYLNLAHKLDLLVLLRIGPYICAEWDLGGFPSWLLAQPQLQLRSSDPLFLNLVDAWWSVLLPKVSSLLYNNGGPIIMVQIENEYGSYGNDKKYLGHLVRQARAYLGESVILYTTDGGDRESLERGTIPDDDVYSAVDFPTDSDPVPIFELQKEFNAPGKSPSLTAEFYTGWLTHWSETFARTNAVQTAKALEKILSLNGSVVLYMAHGGTNFGFFNGANTGADSSDYEPDITSYDYDAPIGEAGDVDHDKFKDLREVFEKFSIASLPDPPPLPLRRAYGDITLRKLASFFDVLNVISEPGNGELVEEPATMESLNQISGFLVYRSKLPAHSKSGSILFIPEVHDRAQVFVWTNPEYGKSDCYCIGVIERWLNHSIPLPDYVSSPGLQLDILVENMGRVNYGPFLYDPKGILSSVLLDDVPVLEWTVYPIPLDDISRLMFQVKGNFEQGPIVSQLSTLSSKMMTWSANTRILSGCQSIGFYQGWLHIDKSEDPADTFLSFKGWQKGVAFINGFNLGRFWPIVGPQCTLYIPAPLLRKGENELIVFELEEARKDLKVTFVDKADFSCPTGSVL